jgi:hypothetical protein
MSGLLLAQPPCLPLLGTLQLPLHETAGDKLAGHMGLRAVGPAVDLGALAFFGQALAQGAGHGHHMDQRALGLSLALSITALPT